ncbi:MAG: hypothetical protein Q7J24_06030 [Desulfomicrobium sp.]|nr:hypothetical protein [Desulfomicrobium sp.]
MENWIQGVDLLKRWGILCFELRGLCRSGALTPTCDQTGFEVTPSSFPCIFCDHEGDGCPHFDRDDCGFANVPGFKTQHAVNTLRESWFKAAEVSACEKAHGLGQCCGKDDGTDTRTPSVKDRIKTEKQSLEVRLKERALVFAGQYLGQNKRMLRDDLRIALIESGEVRNADLTDALFDRIWRSMPPASKHTGGRPKNNT